MPFSIDAYYKVVEKAFRKVMFWSGIGIFLLMEVVIFFDITWSDYGWDFCFHDTLTGANICRNILVGILIAAFVIGVMYLGFYICKRRNIKYFQDKTKGKNSSRLSAVKKDSEKEQEHAEKRKKIHKLLMGNEETRKELAFENTRTEWIASMLSVIFAFVGMLVWLWASFKQDGNFTDIFESTNRVLLAFPGISMICNGYSGWRKSKVAGVAAIFAGVCMFSLIMLR